LELLTFAHKKEATAFLSSAPYTLHKEAGIKYHTSGDTIILITGEGMEKTQMALEAFFENSYYKINHILNLGFAGSLSQDFHPGETFKVVSCHKWEGDWSSEQPLETTNGKNGIELVTSHSRIHDKELAGELSVKAKIVDREFWTIANFAAENALSYGSYKIISDYAFEFTTISLIKKKALDYSKALYDFYLQNSF
jgi:hypothetical protein